MDKKLIKRDIFERVSQHLNKSEITLITGPRQAGKTTLLRQLQAWLISERKVAPPKIFYFDLDLIKDWEFFQDQTEFIEYCKAEAGGGKIYVFVDEAQKVDDCARFFKGVYDSNLNLKLILSGSSSFELKSKLKESLAGRKRIFSLLPFSFNEYISGKANELAHYIAGEKKIPNLVRGKLLKHYFDYLVWGGYPRIALEPNKEERIALLAEIYSSYVEKDIVGLLEIKNKQGFTKLLRLVLAQTGQLVNIAELANMANLDRDTIERYLYALEQTFILKALPPYYSNQRQEIIKQNKIYAIDSGLRNYILENLAPLKQRPDAGFVLENGCFKEIWQTSGSLERLRFWRTKTGAEVDFVIARGAKLLPIEVKSTLKKPQITQGLRSFIDKYLPARAVVINLSLFDVELKIGKTRVSFIQPYEFLKYKESFMTD